MSARTFRRCEDAPYVAVVVGMGLRAILLGVLLAGLAYPVGGRTSADAPAWRGAADAAAGALEVPVGRAEPASRAIERQAFPYTPQVEWMPTRARNFWEGRRAPVEYIVIHYTAVSYERTLEIFRSPFSRVSAHYVVRQDGHIAQLVGEADAAWHAGHEWYNERSVGIEIELDHERFRDPQYTAEQYYATAALTCAIAKRHGIPLDREHVVGHNEIPFTKKLDPGPHWGWPHFMWLTSLCAPPTAATVRAEWVAQSANVDITEGDRGQVTVALRNTGATAWHKGTANEARLAVPGNDTSYAFLADGWPTPDRVAVQTEQLVPPGGVATFTFGVKGAQTGDFVLPLRGVVDGGAWMDDHGIHTKITVRLAREDGLTP